MMLTWFEYVDLFVEMVVEVEGGFIEWHDRNELFLILKGFFDK